MNVTGDLLESFVRQTLTTAKAIHAKTGQHAKTSSLIFTVTVSLDLQESSARLTLMTVLDYPVIMVAHVLTG